MSFADQITRFLFNLKLTASLPAGVQVMNPFQNDYTKAVVEKFYRKFYSDENKRWMIIGINPGRFGGGITGIPFTDPIRLAQDCNIENHWQKKQELSSVFIYDMINAYGGVTNFYSRFYISAVSPLGFTKNNKNLNYYDDKQLLEDIREFAAACIRKQMQFPINPALAFCLGDGRNYKFLQSLNKEYGFFDNLIPLPHPRFIMQYRLKSKQEYIDNYINAFRDGELQ